MTDKHHSEHHAHGDKPAADKSRERLSLNRNGDDSTPKLEERLHKVLAQAGLGSRRALEERINQGLVKVNGEVATIGQSIHGGDRVELDGKVFVASALNEPARVLIYNKPEGEVTTREDPEGRPTIFEALPNIKGARWIAVGRLDINTTGLLLLTTDGELANHLMHPSREVEREYVCRIHGEVPDNIVDRLQRGVALDDGPAKFDTIERINSSDSHSWFRVLVKEGRNREVRRLWESQGFQVSRLKRIRYGSVTLPRLLKRGQSEELPLADVEALQKELGLEGGTQVLTLQPVIGQRKARAEIQLRKEDRTGKAYVNGAMATADEGRELRRFDHVREDRPRRGGPGGRPGGPGRGGPRGPARGGHPGAPRGPGAPRAHARGAHDEQPPASYSHDRPARGGPGGGYRGRPNPMGPQPGAPRHQGAKPHGQGRPPHRGAPSAHAGNSTEFRSWYVPDGVDTGPRSPNGPQQRRGPGRPNPNGPQQKERGAYRGQGAPRPGHSGGHDPMGVAPRPQGDRPPRGDRPHGGMPRGSHAGSPRGPHAGPGRGPHGPRPEGQRPNGPRANASPRGPGGPPQNARPQGPRPDRSNVPRGPRYEGLPRDED
ncbi:MAG TPA: pseudouridine synthase [Xanthomonadaceae bacterium]|nr:pseudouridine synthase [Xanthomonadaceae bacterium]